MRIIVPLAVLLLASAAAAIPPASPTPEQPSVAGRVLEAPSEGQVCRERIQEARQMVGKRTAPGKDTSEPLFIAAVEKQIGGCSVLVMRNDTSDLRDLPAQGQHRLMPAR